MASKVCKCCNKELDLCEFDLLIPHNRPKTYYRGICKDCFREKERIRSLNRYNKVKDDKDYKKRVLARYYNNMKDISFRMKRRLKTKINYLKIKDNPEFRKKRIEYLKIYRIEKKELIASKKRIKYWNNKMDIGVIYIEVEIDNRTALLMFESVYASYHTIIDIKGNVFVYADLI